MESQVVEADTSNPLLRVLEVNRTAEGLVGRFNHFSRPRRAPPQPRPALPPRPHPRAGEYGLYLVQIMQEHRSYLFGERESEK